MNLLRIASHIASLSRSRVSTDMSDFDSMPVGTTFVMVKTLGDGSQVSIELEKKSNVGTSWTCTKSLNDREVLVFQAEPGETLSKLEANGFIEAG